MINKLNNKGAIELSIGTIVIIVLAMSMLILGLVLIRGIFQGSTDNVSELNDKVKEEIRKLFQEEAQKTTLRLTEETAKVKQGSEFGFAFGIKNTIGGTPDQQVFQYYVDIPQETAIDLKKNCGVSIDTAKSWISFGKGFNIVLNPGEIYFDRILLNVPTNAPLCTVKYNIIIEHKISTGWERYAYPYFFVKIQSPGLFG